MVDEVNGDALGVCQAVADNDAAPAPAEAGADAGINALQQGFGINVQCLGQPLLGDIELTFDFYLAVTVLRHDGDQVRAKAQGIGPFVEGVGCPVVVEPFA